MSELISRAQANVPVLREQAPATEEARRVPADTAKAFADAGFFRMLVPAALGGGEVHPRVFVEVLETLGRGDGAAGWIGMTGSTTGLLAAYAADTELFVDPSGIYAGVFAPRGRAKPVEGGYRVSGRWPFTSGVENATVRLGGALVFEGDTPRTLATGEPEIRSFFFTAEQTSVVDTWHTSGLRGTGSHDMVVEDVFVPAERSACVLSEPPKHHGSLYAFPLFGLLSLGISAVGLGIARHALDVIVDVAQHKRSGRKTLAQTELAQVRIARAEGEVRAAKAFMNAAIDEAWAEAEKGELSIARRAGLRLAATHAARAAASAVGVAYELGGGGSIYASSPLQRCFRDVHTMTQHIMVAEATLKPIGRVLLGHEVGTSQL